MKDVAMVHGLRSSALDTVWKVLVTGRGYLDKLLH